jgi:hypothetical protein
LKIILQEFYFKDEFSIGMHKQQDKPEMPVFCNRPEAEEIQVQKPKLFGNNENFAMHLTTITKNAEQQNVFENC